MNNGECLIDCKVKFVADDIRVLTMSSALREVADFGTFEGSI